MRSDDIIENYFQWPRAREAHQGLDHHRDKYNEQRSSIRPYEFTDETRHTAAFFADRFGL
jgi:hypothetical protein